MSPDAFGGPSPFYQHPKMPKISGQSPASNRLDKGALRQRISGVRQQVEDLQRELDDLVREVDDL